MIPVSLTIKGLYSYQQEQTIDFSRLLEGQFFGIFGTVGSGKSTVLEAVSFAMYGETERLNQRDNRNYNMMNLKSDDLFIDFTFKNFDDHLYRFSVRGKRAGNDFETVRTFQRTAYKKVNDSWEPLENPSAEPIIGLSYENFRRTIIIPQGKFQEFLQLGDKARTDMMKEIFHLGKYEFFYQTASLEKKNNEKIQNYQGQLERFREVTIENLAAGQEAVKKLEEELSNLRKQLLEQEKKEKELTELKRLFDELNQKKEALKTLGVQEEHYKKLEQQLGDYEYCLRHFKDKLSRRKELTISLENKSRTITENTRQLQHITTRHNQQETLLEKARDDLKNQDHRKAKLSDYEHLISLLDLEKSISELTQHKAKGEQYIQAETEKGTAIQEKLEKLKTALKTKKASLPDMKVLVEVNNWFMINDQLLKSKEEIGKDIASLQQLMKTTDESAGALYPDFVEKEFPVKAPSVGSYLRSMERFTENSQRKLEELQEQTGHYQLQEKLGAFAGQLQKGEPCPLCGSTHHPVILRVEDVNEHIALAKKQMDVIKDQLKTCDKASRKYHELQATIDNQHRQSETLQTKLRKVEEELNAHKQQFRWNDFHPDNQEKIHEAYQNAEEINQAITRMEEEADLLEKEWKKNADILEKYKKRMDEITSQLTAKSSSHTTLKNQLKVLNVEQHKAAPDILLQQAKKLTEEIRLADERYESLMKETDQLKHQKIALQERIEATRQVLEEDRKSLETIEHNLETILNESSYQTLDEVRAILNEPLDTDKLRSEIARYRQELYKLQQDVLHLEEQVKDKQFDPVSFGKLQSSVQTLREKVQSTNDLLVKEKDALIRLQADLQHKEKLEKELEALLYRAENLSVLRKLFKGNGFINYISSVYLHNLCKSANERFYPLTRQQLQLEVTENNDFRVRDFLNNGRTRSVKTLSGGQIFQASLSLALALAESVQQQNKAQQNFFFLDEGFGSLDKESLQVVFDTLKSLRKENRIVGIISHVEELQQEIDVYLKIHNHPELGSMIEESWKG